MNTAIYPGTFDPITNGHIDIVDRGSKLFDKLIVVIATNSEKKPLFTIKERIQMIKECISTLPNVSVDSAQGLMVDYAQRKKATVLIRGLRFVSDFEMEFQMAWMNRYLNENVTTIFMVPNAKYTHLNSTVIREVAKLGGKIDAFVPPNVLRRLKRKFKQ